MERRGFETFRHLDWRSDWRSKKNGKGKRVRPTSLAMPHFSAYSLTTLNTYLPSPEDINFEAHSTSNLQNLKRP